MRSLLCAKCNALPLANSTATTQNPLAPYLLTCGISAVIGIFVMAGYMAAQIYVMGMPQLNYRATVTEHAGVHRVVW